LVTLVRGSFPIYLIAVTILAGCGGAGSVGMQQISGSGYRFQAPVAWSVTRATATTAASSGPVDLVQVQTFRLVKPYRPELFAAASRELDRVAAQLARQLAGRVAARASGEVAGRHARTYSIEYRDRVDEITFVLDGRREYELLCRRAAASDGKTCRRFLGSFVLD
jgi:hypothetical protein